MEGVVESEDSPNENFEEEEEEEDPNLENQEDEEDEDYQENSSTTVKRKRPLAGISTSHAHISDASHDQPAKKEKKDIVSVAVEEEEEVPEETSPHVDPATLAPYTGTADALPYQLDSLTWDRNHRRNNQHVYCYCGKARTRWSPMLQCSSCRQWFHVECLKQKPKPTPLAGDTAYSFKCAICNNNTEYYQTLTKNWTDIVRVAIYNLLVQEKHRGGSKRFFQYKDEICSFIDKHWDSLCYEKTRTKTWENTIGSALSTKAHYFKSGAEEIGSSGYWGLHNEDDPAFVKESTRGISRQNKDKGFKKKAGGMKGPSSYSKKKGEEKKKLKPVPTIIYYPRLYFDPVAYGYTELRLAKENSAPQVKIHDRFTASNEKGHRMVRASFGVTDGIWYYEIEIPQHSGNTRLGWSSEKGDVQAPVGYDKYSYSYRDKEGTKFHQSRGSPYGAAYGPGDVIGFLINLPPNPNREKKPEPIQDISQKKKEEEEPARLNNSEIRFYKNGEDQGVAFSNIYEGTYYPAGSLYGGGMAKFNFGPTFKYPPRDIQFRPCCEVAAIVLEEARKAAEAAKATEAQAATENGVNSTHQNDNENNGIVKMEMESTPPPLTV